MPSPISSTRVTTENVADQHLMRAGDTVARVVIFVTTTTINIHCAFRSPVYAKSLSHLFAPLYSVSDSFGACFAQASPPGWISCINSVRFSRIVVPSPIVPSLHYIHEQAHGFYGLVLGGSLELDASIQSPRLQQSHLSQHGT